MNINFADTKSNTLKGQFVLSQQMDIVIMWSRGDTSVEPV